MENEFVTYEQALALKELGFNQKCFCYFDNEKELRTCIGLNNWNNHEGFPLFVSALLKQQALRWFREKYYISQIQYYNYDDTYGYQIDGKYHTYNIGYISYNDAENSCIDALIEIAKQQENEK